MATNNSWNTPSLTSAGNGVILIGQTTGAPAATTITAGAGIAITNGANSISIAATGAGNFVNQTTSTATLAAATTYLTNDGATLVTYTLPSSSNVGDSYEVLGSSSGGWTIAQNAGQQVHFGTSSTTSGTGGSLASTNQYDKITIRCSVANTTFIAYNSQGNITVV